MTRYREQKILAQDVGKLIELAEHAYEIAKSAKELVDSKTEAHDELEKLLTLSGDVVEFSALKVDTQLNTISPPCLPFQIDFTLKTEEPSNHNGVYPICFNGEFYKNLGVRLMRIKYTAIDEMYNALEEAELRYARIRGIEKSLSRVEEDIRKTSKRGSIPASPMKDPDDVLLTRISKRRLPAFTLKGDKTTLAFQHYSPWATIKRNDPFEMEPKHPYHVKYNMSNFQSTYLLEFYFLGLCCFDLCYFDLCYFDLSFLHLCCTDLVDVFHDRALSNKSNKIHEGTLRITHNKDSTCNFKEFPSRSNLVSVHQKKYTAAPD